MTLYDVGVGYIPLPLLHSLGCTRAWLPPIIQAVGVQSNPLLSASHQSVIQTRFPTSFFCSALFDTTNIWSRTAPKARYTRPVRCPAAPRHGPGGPWQRTARQFARYGPGWRGGSSAGQPPKHPRWTVAMGARAGSPRRTALISAFFRDGIGQPVVGTDSSKKGAFRKARAPPRQRSARPVCSTR